MMGKKLSGILKGELVSSVFYLVMGLCLVIMPVQTVNIICKIVFGVVLICVGLYHIYIYVREKESATILDLFTGVIVMVLGGFLFFNPQVVVKLLPLLLGALVLVDSIWTFRGSIRLKKRGKDEWKAFLIASFVCVVLGIVMMANPFPKVRQTVMFAGWVFLVNGAADVVFFILLRRGMKSAGEPEENADSGKKEKKKRKKKNGKDSNPDAAQETNDAEAVTEVPEEEVPQEEELPEWNPEELYKPAQEEEIEEDRTESDAEEDAREDAAEPSDEENTEESAETPEDSEIESGKETTETEPVNETPAEALTEAPVENSLETPAEETGTQEDPEVEEILEEWKD